MSSTSSRFLNDALFLTCVTMVQSARICDNFKLIESTIDAKKIIVVLLCYKLLILSYNKIGYSEVLNTYWWTDIKAMIL